MTALNTAKWFIARNRVDYDFGYTDELLTNLKLQKLLYYAQGCVLAITDAPLFEEEFEAWEHGPVIPAIYNIYKSNGRQPINSEEKFDRLSIPAQIDNILEEVYNEFGQFSAWKLRNMTHEETPWKSTKKNQIITKSIIKQYFKENYIQD